MALVSTPAHAFTSVVKVLSANVSDITVETSSGNRYRLTTNPLACDSIHTVPALLKQKKALLYNGNMSISLDRYEFSMSIGGNAALFSLGTGDSPLAADGRCEISASTRIIPDNQGCCSYHGGVKGCESGLLMCNDFTISPSCTCR